MTRVSRCALALLLLSLTPASVAFASSFAGSSAGASTGGTSGTSGSSSGDDKLIVQARSDAAAFVASNGRIRSLRLEAALRHMRRQAGAPGRANDLELAKAILAR